MLDKIKDWSEVVGFALGWLIAALTWAERRGRARAKSVKLELRRELNGATERLEAEINGVGEKVNSNALAVQKIESRVDGVEAAIHNMSRDILEAIHESGRIQTEATHQLGLKVAGLSSDVVNLQRDRQ